MNERKYLIVRGGLYSPKHIKAIGPAVWVYQYMLHTVDWETGKIENWTDKQAAIELGLTQRVVRDHRQRLERADYITCHQSLHSLRISISKWVDPRDYKLQAGAAHGDKKTSPYGDTPTNTMRVTMYPIEKENKGALRARRNGKAQPIPFSTRRLQ